MNESVDKFLRRAEAYYAAGRCDEAIQLLMVSLAENRNHGGLAIRLSELLIDSDSHSRAIEFLRKGIAAEFLARALVLEGVCHQALGDLNLAERCADRVLTENPHRADALALKADITNERGGRLAAEQLFRHAIACDPGCGEAWYGFARLVRDQGDEAAFYNLSQKAFMCSPESRTIVLAFHSSSVAGGRLPEAEAAFRTALFSHRMNRRIRFLLIDLLLRQSKHTEAMAEIETALVDFGIDAGLITAALNVRDRVGPWRGLEAREPPCVSLCMIVRNEEDHLAQCLSSVKPVVDEVIIVDTNSNDQTRDIARVFGAHIYDFAWVDDFSKARNFALSKASGEWVLILDADEVLSAVDRNELSRLVGMSQNGPTAYRIRTRNYTHHANVIGFRANHGEYPEELGIGWFPSYKVRLFTNDRRIRFEYPVHELVEPGLQRLNIPVQDCTVTVHHYGTLKDTKTFEKTRKYYELGRVKVKGSRKNAAALKELAIQAAQLGNHAEALKLWRKMAKLQPRSGEVFLNMGAACLNLGRLGDAVSFSEKALRLLPGMKEAGFNLAFSKLLMGRVGEANTTIERILGSYPDYYAAQFLLCVASICLLDYAKAEALLDKLKSLSIGDYISESFLEISKRLISASKHVYARLTLEAAIRFGCSSPEMRRVLAHCYNEDQGPVE